MDDSFGGLAKAILDLGAHVEDDKQASQVAFVVALAGLGSDIFGRSPTQSRAHTDFGADVTVGDNGWLLC